MSPFMDGLFVGIGVGFFAVTIVIGAFLDLVRDLLEERGEQ